MSVSPISAFIPSQALSMASGLSTASATSALAGITGAGQTPPSGQVTAATFPDIAGAVDALQASQSTADALAVKAVTGDLDDVHDYTIAATQAAVTLELTAAIRNKAVDAFSEIMRMQA